MSFSVQYVAEGGYIAVTANGQIDLAAARAIATEIVRVAAEHDCQLILSDYRAATLSLSTLDIYQMPDLIAGIATPEGVEPRQLRRAVVVASDVRDFSFFETVSRNRAQQVQLFQDVDQARAWLLAS